MGFESYIEIMKSFPPTMGSELRAVGVYLYAGGFPTSPDRDNKP